jgi:O-antigen ligase
LLLQKTKILLIRIYHHKYNAEMKATIAQIKENFHKNGLLIVGGSFIATMTAIMIAGVQWVYSAIILAPFIIYLCIKKPFIFPFGAYVFLLPFDFLPLDIGIAKGGTLQKYLGIMTILVVFLKGSFENKLRKPDMTVIWWILFVLYGTVSILWAIDAEFVMSRIPTAVGLLILYLIVASYKIQKNEFEILKWCILAGGLLTAIILIHSYATGQFFSERYQRATLIYEETKANPNGVAFSLLIPLSICIEKLLKQKTKVKKGLFIAILLLLLFSIVTTGSLKASLAIGAMLIVYSFSTQKKITTGIILIIIGIVLLSFIPETFFKKWENAFETGGAGRLDIWYVGVEALKKYWVIGAGLDNFPLAYNEFVNYGRNFTGFGRAPHNMYLGRFVELGIIGFSLLIWILFKHYKIICSKFASFNNDQVMLKAAFWAVVIVSFFADFMWDKSFWLLLMLIMMYSNNSEIHRLKIR